MDIIILAAGFGSRLKERTRTLPKAMISLQGKPLLQYALDQFLSQEQVSRAIVVTGFERHQVQEFLAGYKSKKPILEVFNPDFQKGNFYSLLSGLKLNDGDFLVTNTDHVFPSSLIHKVLESRSEVGAVCDFDRKLTDDCMKIKLSNKKRVQEIHKKLSSYDCGYIGMTLVREHGRPKYMNAVESVIASQNPQAYAEMILSEMAKIAGSAPEVIDASGFGWLEIDTEDDYLQAEKTLKEEKNFLTFGKSKS